MSNTPCKVSSSLPYSSVLREQSTTSNTDAGVVEEVVAAAFAPSPSGTSYSIVLHSCIISVGMEVAPRNEGGKGDHGDQGKALHLPCCMSICEKGLRTVPLSSLIGACSIRGNESICLSGVYSSPRGEASSSWPCFECGHKCHERRTPERSSRSLKSTPGPGCGHGVDGVVTVFFVALAAVGGWCLLRRRASCGGCSCGGACACCCCGGGGICCGCGGCAPCGCGGFGAGMPCGCGGRPCGTGGRPSGGGGRASNWPPRRKMTSLHGGSRQDRLSSVIASAVRMSE